MHNLRNPPIAEALINIQYNLSSDFNISFWEELIPIFKEYFTDVKKTFKVEKNNLNIEPEKQETISKSHLHNGYTFFNKDKSEVLQIKLDGFAFNFVKKYSGWEDLKGKSLKYWTIFYDFSKNYIRGVNRIGVRFINKISLPQTLNLGDYFVMLPILPDVILEKEELNRMFIRVSFYNKELNCNTIVTSSTLEMKNSESMFDYLLDLDSYLIEDFEINAIWEKIESLRNYKNTLFFSLITEKTLNLFK